MKLFLLAASSLLFFLFLDLKVSFAHEPLYGLGPHVIWQGGLAAELELERNKDGTANKIDIHYGITEDFVIGGAYSFGAKRLTARSKYRFYRADELGASNQAAVVLGLGAGAFTNYLFGLTAGRESRKFYLFGGLSYQINNYDSSNLKKGNRFFHDLAIGFRPWLTEYDEPDLVILFELNSSHDDKDITSGNENPNSGGHKLYFSPVVLYSIGQIMYKGGVKIPILQDLNGAQEKEDYVTTLAVEWHL